MIISRSPAETIAAGREFARRLRPGDVVAVNGTLGSGKTHFVHGVCEGLGATMRATSPTFTLINEYEVPFGKVVHVDLYRITNVSELRELGIEEYFGGSCICLIEWPDLLGTRLPSDRFEVFLEHGDVENERRISIREAVVA